MNEKERQLLVQFLTALRGYLDDLESAVFIPNRSGAVRMTLNRLLEEIQPK